MGDASVVVRRLGVAGAAVSLAAAGWSGGTLQARAAAGRSGGTPQARAAAGWSGGTPQAAVRAGPDAVSTSGASKAADAATDRPADVRGRFHLRLVRSLPAADSTVSALPEIRLWFSQPPQENATAIRLVDGEGELVPTTKATSAEGEPAIFVSRPVAPVAPGSYRVVWRTMAPDGHVVRGTIPFVLGS